MKRYAVVYDIHYPKVHWPTWNAIMDFLSKEKVDGFVFAGDQFDNECISHHTRGKPFYRPRAAYIRDERGFERTILTPLEGILDKKAVKVWIIGNHDRFEFDLVEEQPELEGLVNRVVSLELEARGWTIVPLGRHFSLGKLKVIHGEVLTGIGNQAGMYPSRKAVMIYASSVLAGHTHAPQSFTQVSPVNQTQKWMGWISPIAGGTNPSYMRNRPSGWVNGFTIVEVQDNNNFNVYPVVVTGGKFAYGGKLYGG